MDVIGAYVYSNIFLLYKIYIFKNILMCCLVEIMIHFIWQVVFKPEVSIIVQFFCYYCSSKLAN